MSARSRDAWTDARAACVHLHLFKNAGSTIDWTLKRNFGPRFLAFDDHVNRRMIYTAPEMQAQLDAHPQMLAFASHQLRFPLPDPPDRRLLAMVFIREPIDRVLSVYHFEKRQNDPSIPGSFKAQHSDARAYVEWRLAERQVTPITDFQVQYLSWYRGIAGRQPLMTGENLDTARQRLEQSAVVGVVERLDESLMLAEQVLGEHFPGIDLAYKRQNVTAGRARTLEDRHGETRDALGDGLFERITTLNQHDLQLHRFANELLDQRLAALPDRDASLTAFNARCRLLG